MLAIEIIIVIAIAWTLMFKQVKPVTWTITMAIVLALFTVFACAPILSTIFWLIFVILALFANVKFIRMALFTKPFFNRFQKILPPMSSTERDAIESGDVWWEGDLFAGRPNWKKLHAIPQPKLTAEEQAFLDHEVETLCSMINDWEIVHEHKDMPAEVWQYLKDNRFFGMVIAKEYGGRGFSAFMHSCVVAKIATRSLSVAVNTMVPNSLGPGELLFHYGTEAQKNYYLPRLAKGEEVPCFALTGIDAGSDAGAMTDIGVVCKGEYQGQEVLGIRLSWNKRYITLAPVATVLGLAFKLFDPDSLLGDKKEIGITVCLLPANHPGVEIGRRHYPVGMAFMNGPIKGDNVFVPLDWVIGGPKMIGQGWRMLMECLSIGRGISLPALGAGGGMLNYRTVGAYAKLRKQFKVSIGEFEGIEAPLARIAGYTYILEACRRMTAGAVDLKVKPAVASAIAKYHSSELNRQVFDDSMDIHAGRAIQLGPRNYVGHGYIAVPVGITVEGANILTRNLIIFGQGAIRCHPFVLKEMQAAASHDAEQFDQLLKSHIGFAMSNVVRTLSFGLTGAKFIHTPISPLAYYYKQLTRMSSALAMSADFAMLILGGALKRKESLSARLGDVLSGLYLASTVLKYHADQNSPMEDLPYVRWALEKCLWDIQTALVEFFHNFSHRAMSHILQRVIFPFGLPYKKPSDQLSHQLAQHMMKDSALRDRLTYLCYIGDDKQSVGRMEAAFKKLAAAEPIEQKIKMAIHAKQLSRETDFIKQIDKALAANIINQQEASILREFETARIDSLLVDDFAPEYFKK